MKGPVIQCDILVRLIIIIINVNKYNYTNILQRITKRILKHQYEHNQMFPIRSDTIVLFPG